MADRALAIPGSTVIVSEANVSEATPLAVTTTPQPVWSRALIGLKWGAIAGVALKLIDTAVTFAAVDPRLAVLFVVTVGVCVIPRLGLPAIIVVSIMASKFTRANFFVIGLAAALTGATLGCLPGMAVGGMVGLFRRRATVSAGPTAREPHIWVRAVVLPLIGAATMWALYFFVFMPWVVEWMSRS